MAGKRDFYDVLGVAKEADAEEIKRAYRKLAMQHHPDRNPGDPDAEHKFKEAAEAYEILGDPEKRQRFDRYGAAGLEGMNVPHFNDVQSVFDIFGDLFGDIFGQRRGGRRGPRRGNDLEIAIEIQLQESARGITRKINFEREEVCPDCSGTGNRGSTPPVCTACGGQGVVLTSRGIFRTPEACRKCGGRGHIITSACSTCRARGRLNLPRELEVNIPAGMDTGDRLRISGEGEAGDPGGPRGDLYCLVQVRAHALFRRDGSNLECRVPITFSQAVLGAEIEIPTLEGRITHQLKRGIQSGETLRIPGHGMPNPRGGRKGDLLVRLIVETPRNLTKRQEELFRELAELEHKNVSPERKSFLEMLRGFFAGEPEQPPAKAKGEETP